MQVDVVIIGAGAAGMMCAIEAARRGRSVVVIEHSKSAGEKIRISGGGRCNFTNLDIRPERFLSLNPHFAKSALSRFSQWDFIAMVDQAGIAWHEKTLGQLFCDGSAKEIIAMLLAEMDRHNVTLRLQCSVENLQKTPSGFILETSAGSLLCQSAVIATGGKSIPKMGATGFGYRIAEQFGLALVTTRPGLVPLTFNNEPLKPLAGISVDASVSCGSAEFSEGLLFTHRGLSGPSILQISSYWDQSEPVVINLANGRDVVAELESLKREQGRISIKNALANLLPERLASHIISDLGLDGNLADQTRADLKTLADHVGAWTVKPIGTEGYRTAEVTLGGVDTDGLNARTMEARAVPGLFFIGEVVDVTGWLGGYNFQWAWSSGWAAGQVA